MEQPPHIAVYVSPAMKKSFSAYGDKISFDLTFSLIKEKSPLGNTWKVGVFLGTSKTGRMVPLGVTITDTMTAESYTTIFRMFFEAHDGRKPESIISDE